jgi:sarcosine oxidase, subunit beta
VTSALPDRAEVVVIGGGVMGVSVAFHLAEAGVPDVLLLDRGPLGGGSTSKAAGGVRAQFADELNVALGARSLDLLVDFPTRPGQDIDLHRVGYLFALTRAEDVVTFERAVALQQGHGVPSRMIDATEAARLSPLLRVDDVLAAAYSPDDGHCSPDSVVLGYASGARRLGARLLTGVDVTSVELAGEEIRGVRTDRGTVATGIVVCCAGAWSRGLAATAGVDLPVTPYRRQVVVTGPLPYLDVLPPVMPMTIDYASSFYFHREGPGLLMGMSDPAEPPGFSTHVDEGFLELLAAAAQVRAPRVLEAGVAHRWAGLYEVTPDHNALLGEAEVSRFLYACGFSGHGFLQGPAVGEVVRDLVLGRVPSVDVGPLDAGRFAAGALRRETYVV